MSKLLVFVFIIGLCAVPVGATNLVVNGDFSAGLNGWTVIGAVGLQSGNPWGLPSSPSGEPEAGVMSSWGGNWDGPLGTISQTVNFTGIAFLSGEFYAGAHADEAWRNAGVDVYFNDSIVAQLLVDGDSVKEVNEFSWISFGVPVTGVGANTLAVKYIVHFAEWTLTSVDNLQINTPDNQVSEPSTILLLGSGLIGLVGYGRRWFLKK